MLRRSVDIGKDQSYVLAVLTAEQLSRAVFPLGGSTKDEVREEARRRGLQVADKPDSHDICFIADGDTRGFLNDRLGGARPGEIVDTDGAVVGEHDGAFGYTIGQRRGLRIGTPAPDGKPRYVLDIEPVSNRVTVGTADQLAVAEIRAVRPVWSGPEPSGTFTGTVQLRAHGEVHACTATIGAEGVRVHLPEPARGVARGQAAVFYEGDRVVGSATIDDTVRAAVPA